MNVFERAWAGLGEFWREFDAGPYKGKGKVGFVKGGGRVPGLPVVGVPSVPKFGTRPPTEPKRKRGKPKLTTNTRPVKPERKTEKAARKRALKKDLKKEARHLKPKREVEQFEKDPNWNAVLKEEEPVRDPAKRAQAIQDAKPEKKVRQRVVRMLNPVEMARNRKHLLFMNPGTEKVLQAVAALESGGPLPVWALPFASHLSVEDHTLYYDDLEVATKETKRELVKRLYFDPKGPSTIRPITDALRDGYANVTKKDVSRILRSLETYQRNFRRRLPGKVQGRMVLTKPGVIMLDTFYPSKAIDGWRGKYACLCCMDAWSRYSRVYVLANKTGALVQKHIEKFLAEFAGRGHMPRMILCDKGSELKGAAAAIERYRTKPGDLVHNSVTGQPVLMVENMQSQYQRRMAVFRTASLTDDPSAIMHDISEHLNNQKRPNRGGLTPVQLLSLRPAEIKKVNDELHVDRGIIPDLKGLPELRVGHSCRILLMTRKEQVDVKMKGFRPKWSRRVYRVLKKTKLQLNPNHFRYYVGSNQSYYRHELLYIPHVTDTEVVHGLVGGEGSVGGLDYDPDEESDYDPADDD